MLRLGIGVTGPFKHNPLHLSISKDEACIFHKRSSSQAAQNLITGFHICTHGYNRTGASIFTKSLCTRGRLSGHYYAFSCLISLCKSQVLLWDRACVTGRQAGSILCCKGLVGSLITVSTKPHRKKENWFLVVKLCWLVWILCLAWLRVCEYWQ